jgi:hypothetical protein
MQPFGAESNYPCYLLGQGIGWWTVPSLTILPDVTNSGLSQVELLEFLKPNANLVIVFAS